MSRARIIDIYMAELKKPGSHIDLIKKDMESKGLPEDEVRAIIKYIDAQIKKKAQTDVENKKANRILLWGIILFFSGLITSFMIYQDIHLNSPYSIIMYSPLIIGMLLIIKGIIAKK
ncbi:hypothetical protein OO013_01945 [Mangrovivirga sp. M17]|uniref:DUF2335 domain-containing protein n=1 Tax=Mangrovivirga halotolerans TaxID=2993936 RepID=A0ABT3RM14_9BACT|nr:hypothetical protein [Mangrovivirga halotolerans]MCX2742605.1 hypothetical protein [Mangrovivirga halotolerans]